MFKNALVSVSNKTGLVEFLKPLIERGLRVISTGGTLRHLQEHGLPVTSIEEYTGFPEVMGGRVRTLHPKVHMALLARADHPEDMALLAAHGIAPIDLVVVNLYPFEQTLTQTQNADELVEEIDIGGPALLRASAKNFARVTVICDPADYSSVGESSTVEQRRYLASKVFAHTSCYDSVIASEFLSQSHAQVSLGGHHLEQLRYGENPQQQAHWYKRAGSAQGLQHARVLQGKALSFNNLLDLNAAILTVREFTHPAAVAVKHNNPCGVAESLDVLLAVTRATQADPMSVYGGIVAVNRSVGAPEATFLGSLFLECLIAPQITDEARALLASRKNLRVLEWPQMLEKQNKFDVKMIEGGFLVQSLDHVESDWSRWKLIGPEPSAQVKTDLVFAWKVCAHLKSNAIAIAEGQQTLGLGMGQVNRVEAVAHAIERMRRHHPQAQCPVLASDAFFPFADSIEVLAQAGVRYVIQPGGSVKDDEVIRASEQLGVTMVLTGKRHFQH